MNFSEASANRRPLRLLRRLHVRIALLQLLVTLAIMTATLLVFKSHDRGVMLRQGYLHLTQIGQHIAERLSERVILVEGLTGTLANLGESLEPDPVQFKTIIPHLLDYESNAEFIAGGGIWPEPYAFDPSRERSSFFWGRDDYGILQYFDDYNDPRGPGYHYEEWYVPAKFMAGGQGFWSKSYMDPYSHQPMVTCSVAMQKGGKFSGVATCDLRLEGLDNFFKQSASAAGGYIFALDRNHKFLSFPRPHMIRREYTTDSGGRKLELFYISELVSSQPVYAEVEQALGAIDDERLDLAQRSGRFRADLVDELANGSYQINKQEARRIVAGMNEIDEIELSKQLTWDDDPILGGPAIATVVHMPRTHWNLVVVARSSWVYGSGDSTPRKVILTLLALELLGSLALFPILKTLLARPLRRLLARLQKPDLEPDLGLDTRTNDEWALLAQALEERLAHLSHSANESERLLQDQTTHTLRNLLDQLPWPAALVAEDNRFGYQNPAFRHCFAQAEAKARLIAAVFETDHEPTLGHRLIQLELDGDIYPFHTLCLTIPQDQAPPLIALVAVDIGDQLEEELIRRERAGQPPQP